MAVLVRHDCGPHGSVNRAAACVTVASLASGIGGFDLGLQRAGMTIAWQCEIDPFCRQILAKHWPDVARYPDLTTLSGFEEAPVDLVCAGFPCQSISVAGKQQGMHDHDRWLWPSIRRLVARIRPRWVVLENTPNLLAVNDGNAFAQVLGDLCGLWYDCEWDLLSAQDVGAPHLRRRLFIIGRLDESVRSAGTARPDLADTDDAGRQKQRGAESMGTQQRSTERRRFTSPRVLSGRIGGTWPPQPDVLPVVDGLSTGMDDTRRSQITALGNSIVPQIAEWIGRRIIECDR